MPQLPSSEEEIPDPPPHLLRALAAQAYEVIAGTRGVSALGTGITMQVASQLREQRAALAESRQIYRDRRNPVHEFGQVRVCRIQACIAEATVTLHTTRRSHAVAMRLEWVHSRWRACELFVL